VEYIYAFPFDGCTLLLSQESDQKACRRAYHERIDTYDLSPDRLDKIDWPSEDDYERLAKGKIEEPVILEGG